MTNADDDAYPAADWSNVPEEFRFLIPAADKYVTRPLDNDRIVALLESITDKEIATLTPLARAVGRQEFLDRFNKWFGNQRKRSVAEWKLYAFLQVIDDSVPDSPFFCGY